MRVSICFPLCIVCHVRRDHTCFYQEKEDCLLCSACSKVVTHFCEYYNLSHAEEEHSQSEEESDPNRSDTGDSDSSDELRRFPLVRNVVPSRFVDFVAVVPRPSVHHPKPREWS